MARFEFLLKNEKIKSYRRIAIFLIIINVAVFILFSFGAEGNNMKIVCLSGAAILTFFLLIHFYFNPARKSIYQTIALCIAIIVWLLLYKWLAAMVCFVLLLLYLVSIRPLKINVSIDNVQYISFPVKILRWQDLSNVILKDDILTIDFKSNKIFQAEVEKSDMSVNEREFNDFCRQQLKEHAKSNK